MSDHCESVRAEREGGSCDEWVPGLGRGAGTVRPDVSSPPPRQTSADPRYTPFDFHAKCHGMKWENISELVEEVDFGKMGYFWSLANEPLREQVGAFRTK